MRRRLAMLGVALVLSAGCGADAPEVGPETSDGADAVELGSGENTRPAPAGPEDEPAPESSVDETEPGSDETAEANKDSDIETVDAGGAGEVDVRIVAADEIALVDVRPAAGWTHTVDEDEGDEIELEFRHEGGRTVDVEITVDGGRVTAEIG